MQRLGSGGVPAWVKVVGVLAGTGNNDVLTYPACRLDYNGRQCNKKVQSADDGSDTFYCSRCNQNCVPMYRYLLQLQFVDFTGVMEGISVFGELGDTVMGMTADEAHQVRSHAAARTYVLEAGHEAGSRKPLAISLTHSWLAAFMYA